jgi:hypothetical protein
VCREERTHHRDHRVHREDRKFKKDVNLEGTNSASSLESTKVPKNELKTNSKRTGKTHSEYAEKPKRSRRVIPKRQLQEDTNNLP